MLPTIISKELMNRRISIREAARQIGIAHTTLIRILGDKAVDLTTLDQVGKWLQTPVSTLLDVRKEETSSMGQRLEFLIRQNLVLADAMEDLLNKVYGYEIDPQILEEVLAFLAFKIKLLVADKS
jgi:transcriptional regulator with XRE-family HTH domain